MVNLELEFLRHTTKSSRRLVSEMPRMLTSGIFRSIVVETRPSFAVDMTK